MLQGGGGGGQVRLCYVTGNRMTSREKDGIKQVDLVKERYCGRHVGCKGLIEQKGCELAVPATTRSCITVIDYN